MSCLWECSPLKWSRWNTTGKVSSLRAMLIYGKTELWRALGFPIPVKVKSAHTPQAFVRYGTTSLPFSSNYGHPSSLPDLLTWRGMLIEMSGHFSQCVPPAGVARDADGVVIRLNFIFQLLLLPYFFTNGGLQQAVGGDGAVPEEPVEVGIHRKEHRLQNMSDHRLRVFHLFLHYLLTLFTALWHVFSTRTVWEATTTPCPNAKPKIGGREQQSHNPCCFGLAEQWKKGSTQFSWEHQPVMDCSCHSPFLPARMAESGSEVAGKAEMIAGFH